MMPRDDNGELRLLSDADRRLLTAAAEVCRRAGYVRAPQVLARVLARDLVERGPRIVLPAFRDPLAISYAWRAHGDG